MPENTPSETKTDQTQADPSSSNSQPGVVQPLVAVAPPPTQSNDKDSESIRRTITTTAITTVITALLTFVFTLSSSLITSSVSASNDREKWKLEARQTYRKDLLDQKVKLCERTVMALSQMVAADALHYEVESDLYFQHVKVNNDGQVVKSDKPLFENSRPIFESIHAKRVELSAVLTTDSIYFREKTQVAITKFLEEENRLQDKSLPTSYKSLEIEVMQPDNPNRPTYWFDVDPKYGSAILNAMKEEITNDIAENAKNLK